MWAFDNLTHLDICGVLPSLPAVATADPSLTDVVSAGP